MAISFSFHSLFHFLSFSFSFSFSFPLSLTLFISFFLFFFILYLSLSLSLLLFVIVYHLTLCTYDRYMYNLFLCISDCVCLQVYLLPVLHRGPLVLQEIGTGLRLTFLLAFNFGLYHRSLTSNVSFLYCIFFVLSLCNWVYSCTFFCLFFLCLLYISDFFLFITLDYLHTLYLSNIVLAITLLVSPKYCFLRSHCLGCSPVGRQWTMVAPKYSAVQVQICAGRHKAIITVDVGFKWCHIHRYVYCDVILTLAT